MAILERTVEQDSRPAPSGRVAGMLRRHPALWVGMLVTAVSYIGAGVPSYWGDEAASVLSAQRSWSSLVAELSTVDAVHGLYYVLLHVWIDVFGPGEWATRALSTVAVGLLAAGVVVLGSRWMDTRTGVIAGLLVMVIPRASVLSIEARGYALAAAAAVWITVLFVALAERGARRRAWLGYAVAVAAGGTLFLYLLLLPLVHLTLLVSMPGLRARRQSIRRWFVSMILAGVLSLPILIAASLQKSQVAFLAHRGYMSPKGWFISPWFGHAPTAIVMWSLLAVGVVALLLARRRRASASPAVWGLLVWLCGPALVLVAIDVAVSPTYNPRYLSICLGAVALLVAAGAVAVYDAARTVGGRRGAIAGALAVALAIGVTAVPEYVRARGPYAKDGGADAQQAAALVGSLAARGDTVLYGTATRPSRAPRLVYRLYPDEFAGLDDPQLRRASEDTDGLWDELATVADIAPDLRDGRVWLIETGETGSADSDIAALESAGFAQIDRVVVHRTVIYQFEKGMPR